MQQVIEVHSVSPVPRMSYRMFWRGRKVRSQATGTVSKLQGNPTVSDMSQWLYAGIVS